MGDIAEMILEGILCEVCSIYIQDGEKPGYPRKCESCEQQNKERERFGQTPTRRITWRDS